MLLELACLGRCSAHNGEALIEELHNATASASFGNMLSVVCFEEWTTKEDLPGS